MTSDAELMAATATNHRAWFERGAGAPGGAVESAGGTELYFAGEATIAFPPPDFDPDAAMAAIRRRGYRGAGCWSLADDPALGARLVARGFTWGWEPHWMALDLEAPQPLDGEGRDGEETGDGFAAGDGERAAGGAGVPRYDVIPAAAPYAESLPYSPRFEDGEGVHRLGIRLREKLVGQVVVFPAGGVAGIYDMGVVAKVRRRGLGLALTRAACDLARELGCRHATLNATDDGEPLYRRAGFRSLGRGRTWWYRAEPPPGGGCPGGPQPNLPAVVRARSPRTPAPLARQVRLAEAIGDGDLALLAALDPSLEELEAPFAGGTTPLQLAVLTGRVEVAAGLLDRAPRLAEQRFEPDGGTLLHLAVEEGSADLLRLALQRGVDPSLRDTTHAGTARGWAEHLDLPELAALLPADGAP